MGFFSALFLMLLTLHLVGYITVPLSIFILIALIPVGLWMLGVITGIIILFLNE